MNIRLILTGLVASAALYAMAGRDVLQDHVEEERRLTGSAGPRQVAVAGA